METLLDASTGSFLSGLKAADQYLFQLVNAAWTNSALDAIYPWWREANTWVPLYLFLILFSLMNFGRKAIPWILFAVLTVVLTDQISSTLIKNWVERLRPCSDPAFADKVRLLLNHCSGGYSFPSSHATNHFGFAMYVFMTLRPVFKKWSWLFFVWAASIAYGQVYVGVHYPADVLFGSGLGLLLGYGTAKTFLRNIGPLYDETLIAS
jgi:undecaprenyl-diphosphatase